MVNVKPSSDRKDLTRLFFLDFQVTGGISQHLVPLPLAGFQCFPG